VSDGEGETVYTQCSCAPAHSKHNYRNYIND